MNVTIIGIKSSDHDVIKKSITSCNEDLDKSLDTNALSSAAKNKKWSLLQTLFDVYTSDTIKYLSKELKTSVLSYELSDSMGILKVQRAENGQIEDELVVVNEVEIDDATGYFEKYHNHVFKNKEETIKVLEGYFDAVGFSPA